MHYEDLTCVSWSPDGQILSVSSLEGYISFIRFEENAFGKVFEGELITVESPKLTAPKKPPKKSVDPNASTSTPKATASPAQVKDKENSTPNKTPSRSANVSLLKFFSPTTNKSSTQNTTQNPKEGNSEDKKEPEQK